MNDHFEAQKNLQAGGYTLLTCICLLILFLFVKWTMPVPPPPPPDEGIEVNLGNSDIGLGNNQPFLPGEPAPTDKSSYTPPQHNTTRTADSRSFETNDKDEEAPEIKKPPVTKPEVKKIPEKDVIRHKAVKHPQPENSPPAPPHPKAVFKGVKGTGTGGNEADSYKPGGSEGVAGGKGDQGAPGGDPNSKNYTGGGHGSGVTIARGLQGRKITRWPSFQDDFNENAKVAVDIQVDENGKVISAVYSPRGSTTSLASMKSIAIRKAYELKFNSNGEQSVGTILFNFKLHD